MDQEASEPRRRAPSGICGCGWRYPKNLRELSLFAMLAAALLAGCGKSPSPIVVGSQSVTGQTIVAEIVAQHLEHRLGRKIERRLGLGTGLTVYQELQLQRISVYPAFTGAIESEILKERADPDPAVVWERTHAEVARIAKMELFNPLGYDNPPAVVVRAADAEALKVATLSQAAAGPTNWKIGVSYEFQQQPNSVTALNSYNLPTDQGIRGMEPGELFPALQMGHVTMIATDSIDGRIDSPDVRMLADDRHAFPPYQACLMTRQDVLAAEPQLRGYLAELSGKFTTEGVRKMSAEVDLNHRAAADVAAEFLTKAGLK